MKQNPKVFIVIVNWNGLKDTRECLISLIKLDYENFNVVLVDNASNNDELSILFKEFPFIIPIRNKINVGFTGGTNIGIKYSLEKKADYVLILNNDTIVQQSFLTKLVFFMEKNEKYVAISPLILYPKNDKIWSAGGKLYKFGIVRMIDKGKLYINHNSNIEPDFLSGCCIMMRGNLIDSIGLFDNDYFAYYEDIDWSFRAKRIGYKIKVLRDSIIYHKKSSSAGISGKDKLTPLQAYYYSRNGLIFCKKNLKGLNKTFFSLGHITIRSIYSLVHFQNFRAIGKYFLGLIEGVNYNFRKNEGA